MRATGIVRRIDDLGRITIPKEIRRLTHIEVDDPLEIFIEDGGIVLQKYLPSYVNTNILKDMSEELVDMIDEESDIEKRTNMRNALEALTTAKEALKNIGF